MYNIQTLNSISPLGLALLPNDSYIIGHSQNPDAILVRSTVMHDNEIPDSLLCVGRAGAGVNNIPIDEMTRHGIVVFNAPGANANAVKELVIAGMLLGARNITQSWAYTHSLNEDGAALHQAVEAGKKKFKGFELPGRTLGVIGLGAIGVRVANAARALGMNVIGFDPGVTVARAWELDADVVQASDVEELLNESDFVTFHVPLIKATRHLINKTRLQSMRDNLVILNFARDEIVDETAILEGLNNGKIYSYVSDFPSKATINHPRCITLPHLGASTKEAEDNCAMMVVKQIREYLEHGIIKNSVNFPEVKLTRKGEARIAVVNQDVPDMVGQISHVLGEHDLNIIHMVNESRGNIAYNLIDVNASVPRLVRDKLTAIAGVLRVRIL